MRGEPTMIQTMRTTIQSVLFMLTLALFGPVAASAAQGEFVVATRAATDTTLTAGQWVRFAESSVSGWGNNAGVFDIRWTGTNTATNIGGHVRVSIGANSNDETQIGMVLNDASSQGAPAIGRVRLLEGAAGTTMYLEAYVGVALLSLEFVHEAGYGWALVVPTATLLTTLTTHELDTTGAFAVNEGSKSFMVTKDGKVGIGTTTPGQKLSVAGTIESSSGFKFPDGTTQTSSGTAAGWTENTTANTVYTTTTGRNVGIGTTTPGYKLDVSGDIRAANHVYVGSSTLDKAGSKTAQKEENGTATAEAGWHRVAHIDSAHGRGQNTVTVYTNGGNYDPRSTTIRWWHDYSTDVGLTILSETGSLYWTDARVTDDGNNSYLEINFQRAITSNLFLSMQYDGGYARGSLYSGPLPKGGGNIRATAPMGLLTVGTDKFFINTAGKVGIGTTTPGQKLSVAGTIESSSGGFKFPDGTTQTSAWTAAGWTENASANTVYTTTGRNIGIGTMAPVNKLDVEGGLAVGATYSGTNTAPTNGLLVEGNVGIGTTAPANKLDVEGGLVVGATYSGTNTAPTNGLLVEGNVGIGTTTPGYKLDVSGDIRAANHVYVGSATLYKAGSKTAQKEENVGATVADKGWYRVAYIADSHGRGQNTVTVYTTGGVYAPRSTTIRWWHDYSTNAGLTILSETGSHYWDEARITGDTPGPDGYNTKAYLEIHFTQDMPEPFYLSMQYDGGYARGGLYFDPLLPGGGTVYATAPTGLLTVGTDKFFINTAGKVGIGTTAPVNKLDVEGGLAVGATYSGTNTAPTNGLLVEGNVGIGTSAPAYKLDVVGGGPGTIMARFSGDVVVEGNIAAKYQDVAEWVPAAFAIPSATVVVLDTQRSNTVLPSAKRYDTGVAGVVTTTPGIVLGEAGSQKVKVATFGRVKVKADAQDRAISVGDLLVTSDRAGMAMKSEPVNLGDVSLHRPGTIIGKALEPLSEGQGEILVLLSAVKTRARHRRARAY